MAGETMGNMRSDQPFEKVLQFSKQYVSLQDVSITNSIVQTSALSDNYAGTGKTILAGKLKAGSIIRIRGGGLYTTPTLTAGTALTLRVLLGGVTIATAVVPQTIASATNLTFDLSMAIIVRNTGAAAVVVPYGTLSMATPTGRLVFDMTNTGALATVNTNVDMPIDITLQWAVATATRIAKVQSFNINIEA